jgi:hypothetical protein
MTLKDSRNLYTGTATRSHIISSKIIYKNTKENCKNNKSLLRMFLKKLKSVII